MDRLSLGRSSGHEPLAAIDVEGCAREGRVGHDVHSQRSDVARFYPGEDHVGSLEPRTSRGLQCDASGAADYDDVCASRSGSRRLVGVAVSVLIVSSFASVRHRRARGGRLGRRRYLVAEDLQRGDVDLRERGEWLDRVGKDLEGDVGADREGGLL